MDFRRSSNGLVILPLSSDGKDQPIKTNVFSSSESALVNRILKMSWSVLACTWRSWWCRFWEDDADNGSCPELDIHPSCDWWLHWFGSLVDLARARQTLFLARLPYSKRKKRPVIHWFVRTGTCSYTGTRQVCICFRYWNNVVGNWLCWLFVTNRCWHSLAPRQGVRIMQTSTNIVSTRGLDSPCLISIDLITHSGFDWAEKINNQNWGIP